MTGTTINGKTTRTPLGTDLVPLFPDGNATAQSIANLLPTVAGFNNVLTFGADPTGATDSTTAIQNAINAHGITLFPSGTYLHTTLTLPANAYLLGVGAGGTNFEAANSTLGQSILKLKNGTNASQILIPTGASNCVLENLWLDGNGANQSGTSHNVEIPNSTAPGSFENTFTKIYRCGIHDAKTNGVYIGLGRGACSVAQSWVMLTISHGIVVNGSDCEIEGTLVGACGSGGAGTGVLVGPDSTTIDGIHANALVTRITNCDIFSNANGVLVTSPMVSIHNCGIDRNMLYGVRVAAGCTASVGGCLFHYNSRAANGTYADVATEVGAFASVVGNIFANVDGAPVLPAFAAQIFGAGIGGAPAMFYAGNQYQAGSATIGETNAIPTASGSRGDNAGLASLLSALAASGLIVDSTTGTVTVSSPAVTSGAAFIPSATSNTMVYLTFALAGTVSSVTMGPSTGAENAVYGTSVIAVGGGTQSLRVPVGWKVIVTTVTSTITAKVVTC